MKKSAKILFLLGLIVAIFISAFQILIVQKNHQPISHVFSKSNSKKLESKDEFIEFKLQYCNCNRKLRKSELNMNKVCKTNLKAAN